MGIVAELRRISSQVLTATDGKDVIVNSPDGWAVERPELWWSNGEGIQGPFGHPIPGAGAGFASWGNIPAVARCTSIIVDELAAVPWKLYRNSEVLPSPDWITDPQALRLDGRVVDPQALPETRLSHVDFWSAWLTDALWWGDGLIWAPNRDAYGAPKPPMGLIPPDAWDFRERSYYAGDRRLPGDELIHLRGPGPIVNGRGSGALTRFAADLGYTLTVKDYAASVFFSGVPSGYLKVNTPNLTQPKADELSANWDAKHGTGIRKTAVLNQTTDYTPLTWSPESTTLVDVIAANLNELANAFGVPGYMIGAPGDQATYANLEGRRRDLVTFTYLPWSSRIEAVLDAQFPRGVSLKVALDGLQRGDASTRGPFLTSMVAAGIYPKAYAQDLEDIPPQYIEDEPQAQPIAPVEEAPAPEESAA